MADAVHTGKCSTPPVRSHLRISVTTSPRANKCGALGARDQPA
eukprot:CAMPEP_0182908050 /NCGR_PEP_ID=MMETSP0034_2-20130328/34956_1 /TAXON_ID=156128 /ORGANISM="Nephroselmis pyriformis, Strain CCMP717" /LENGTH=42 /DNA_ID= /DNA_START= /DNA_END= /DNA_ORIENTATION=